MYTRIIICVLVIVLAAGLAGCVALRPAERVDFSRTLEEQFERIDLQINWGECKIVESQDGKTHIEAIDVPSAICAEVKNGTLVVTYGTNSGTLISTNGKTAVTIELPTRDYEKMKFEFGAGKAEMEGLHVQKLDIETGAGSVEVANSVLEGLNAEIGAGKFTYSGTVNGDIKVECGVGEVNLKLTNPQSDFNGKYKLNVEKGVGTVNVSYNHS